jgi:hypothetical protein
MYSQFTVSLFCIFCNTHSATLLEDYVIPGMVCKHAQFYSMYSKHLDSLFCKFSVYAKVTFQVFGEGIQINLNDWNLIIFFNSFKGTPLQNMKCGWTTGPKISRQNKTEWSSKIKHLVFKPLWLFYAHVISSLCIVNSIKQYQSPRKKRNISAK